MENRILVEALDHELPHSDENSTILTLRHNCLKEALGLLGSSCADF
jgi:hypothetical protein